MHPSVPCYFVLFFAMFFIFLEMNKAQIQTITDCDISHREDLMSTVSIQKEN